MLIYVSINLIELKISQPDMDNVLKIRHTHLILRIQTSKIRKRVCFERMTTESWWNRTTSLTH